jgi:hypothetical protein
MRMATHHNDFSTRKETDIVELLKHEIAEAHRTIRALMRKIDATQEQQARTQHAYEQMKQNIIEMNREHTLVEREREMWRMRAEQSGFEWGDQMPNLSSDEINAIRRAMARLHHPDHGGDSNRMKQWNKLLDQMAHKTKPVKH